MKCEHNKRILLIKRFKLQKLNNPHIGLANLFSKNFAINWCRRLNNKALLDVKLIGKNSLIEKGSQQ